MPGPGRDLNFVLLPGPGFFFIAVAGPGSEFFYIFFYCRGRGRAGIKNFELTGAEAGPGSEFFYCRGRAGIYIFLLPGPGRD